MLLFSLLSLPYLIMHQYAVNLVVFNTWSVHCDSGATVVGVCDISKRVILEFGNDRHLVPNAGLLHELVVHVGRLNNQLACFFRRISKNDGHWSCYLGQAFSRSWGQITALLNQPLLAAPPRPARPRISCKG